MTELTGLMEQQEQLVLRVQHMVPLGLLGQKGPLESLGIDPGRRPQTLRVEELVAISNHLTGSATSHPVTEKTS